MMRKLSIILLFAVSFMLFNNCQQQLKPNRGEYKLIEVPSPSLSKALINSKQTQKVGIYLPPSYHTTNKHYPVVYNLTGFTVHPGEYPPTQWIDSLMTNSLVEEMIFVEISGYNLFQGTMYANSPVTGNWEDFVTKDVIHYIDHTYRTIPEREARGISGHSMGGAGCFNISLKHADKYAVAYPMSPAISANASMVKEIFAADSTMMLFNQLEKELNGVADQDFHKTLAQLFDTTNVGLLWSLGYGMAFAADLEKPLKMKLPYELKNGKYELNSEIYDLWLNGFDNIEQKVEKYENNLKQYRYYSIDCGYYDEIKWLKAGTQEAIKQFEKRNIPHSAHWYDGDHVNRVGDQMANRVLPIMSAYLKKE